MRNSNFIIDTNTLISAFLLKQSVTKSAYEKAKQTGNLIASEETYDEFCEVLLRPKFDKYLSVTTRIEITAMLKNLFLFIEPSETISVCRDPKDNKFLELAVSVKASCIITGDNDLLVLHPFRGTAIMNAFNFINEFETR